MYSKIALHVSKQTSNREKEGGTFPQGVFIKGKKGERKKNPLRRGLFLTLLGDQRNSIPGEKILQNQDTE